MSKNLVHQKIITQIKQVIKKNITKILSIEQFEDLKDEDTAEKHACMSSNFY